MFDWNGYRSFGKLSRSLSKNIMLAKNYYRIFSKIRPGPYFRENTVYFYLRWFARSIQLVDLVATDHLVRYEFPSTGNPLQQNWVWVKAYIWSLCIICPRTKVTDRRRHLWKLAWHMSAKGLKNDVFIFALLIGIFVSLSQTYPFGHKPNLSIKTTCHQ
jgi:hypothetical protein